MNYEPPKHMVAVSAYVENIKGEALLLRTHLRSETWELPGGFVEVGEPLDQAVCREFLEETGVVIRPLGITGVYYNQNRNASNVLSVVFKAELESGEIRIQPEEILEAKYVRITESNVHDYFKRPHLASRVIDALRATLVPFETWDVTPPSFKLLSRVNRE